MPSPGISTFDGNPNATPPTTVGYRPGPDDFDGAELEDDPVNVPDPETMPTSAQMNTRSLLLVSICKAIGVAGFGINASASPTFAFFWTAANLIVGNPFTLTRVGAGHYQITWAAGQFPIAGWPRVRLNTAVVSGHSYSVSALNMTNGIEVWTFDNGALADLSFSAEAF